jgi:hypothetical protein
MSNYHDEIWRIVNTISFDPAGTHTGHREIEALLRRALAEQREGIAQAIHATRKPGDFFITHQHVQIARTFGQTGEGDDD